MNENNEIEFSKHGEGKVLIGIGCRRLKDGTYQKKLIFDRVITECVVKDKLHKSEAGETMCSLIFNIDDSIDVLINKLKELKKLNPEKVLKELDYKHNYCVDPNCSCQLAKGC